jgi:hypothetical protein
MVERLKERLDTKNTNGQPNIHKSPLKITYIYALKDPRDGQIRYVGKTDRKPEQRLKRHLSDPSQEMEPWVSNLRGEGLIPLLEVLEEIPKPYDWSIAEIWWIKEGLKRGWNLLNTAYGGGNSLKLDTVNKSGTTVLVSEQPDLMKLILELSPLLSNSLVSRFYFLHVALELFSLQENNAPNYHNCYMQVKNEIDRLELQNVMLLNSQDTYRPFAGMSSMTRRKDGLFSQMLFLPVEIRDLLEELAFVQVDNFRRGFEPVLLTALRLLKQIINEVMQERRQNI